MLDSCQTVHVMMKEKKNVIYVFVDCLIQCLVPRSRTSAHTYTLTQLTPTMTLTKNWPN